MRYKFVLTPKSDYMANHYAKKSQKNKMIPKKDTVSFLLNYSKSFKVLRIKDFSFQFYLN